MSSQRNILAAVANDVAPGGGPQQEELSPEDFDGLLPANMLDTLVDFDFSYAELAAGVGPDAAQQQQHQPLQLQPQRQRASPSPKLSGRKRSFTQACSWDNLGPKALSEISAGLLAGGGGGCWENGGMPLLAESAASAPYSTSNGGVGAPGASTPPAGGSRKSQLGGACSKGRRGSAGEGKRPLNPDRMERKATREKRRREEVNQKFEQLLQVLEDAESTSGLEPPAAEEGKAAHACINGRRVEVLSRTIKVLKKLLRERRDSLNTGGSCSSRVEEGTGGEAAVSSRGRPLCAVQAGTEACRPLAAASAGSAVSDSCRGVDSASAAFAAGVDAAPGSFEAPGPLAHAAAEAEVPAAATAPAAAATLAAATATAGSAAGGAANPPVVHHMAVPVSGHHASMIMPPGFASMPPGHSMPPGSHSMPPGSHGQPFFIAVPMYMPQGQGVQPPPAESAAQAPAAPSVPAVPSAAAAAAARPPPPSAAAETKKEAVSAPSGKEAWTLASMGYHQSMMALQMPQFVTQALSTEEGDESPTHAVCA